MTENLNKKQFPNKGDPKCSHTIGCYKSGRCRSCGYKVWEGSNSRAKRINSKDLKRLNNSYRF